MATRKPRAADAEKKAYEVIDPLRHDDVDYAIGEPVDLTADEAETLIKAKVVKAVPAEAG